MSAIDNTPINRNFISPLNFRFQIKKCPGVNFFVQKVNIPGLSMNTPEPNNPFVKTPIPGDHIEYETLDLTFKVDEDLQNYLEIHNWIRALGKPSQFEEYRAIEQKPSWTGEGIYSDISLIALNSAKNPNYEVVFMDGFPIKLSSITFNTVDPDVEYLEATAVFKYTLFDISKI